MENQVGVNLGYLNWKSNWEQNWDNKLELREVTLMGYQELMVMENLRDNELGRHW